MTHPPTKPPRLALIDALRGVALFAMAAYHFSWDLEFFGLAALGVTEKPAWILFARSIASSFLALVGVSLVLAHGDRLRLRGFLQRLAMVAAAAAAVTAMSLATDPEAPIWFGILHCIAVSSVLGLAFLRAPPVIVLAAAAFCIAAPYHLTSPAFDGHALLWLGLGSTVIPSNDYDPLLPWFGPVLIGIVLGRLVLPRLAKSPLAAWQPRSMPARALAFAGRHSLIFYLMHQPILIGILSVVTRLTGTPAA